MNLNDYFDGKLLGHLSHEKITELLEPLNEFRRSIRDKKIDDLILKIIPMVKKETSPKEIKPFPEYLIFTDKDNLAVHREDVAKFLRSLFHGAGGKKIACIIQALKRLHKIIPYHGSGTMLYESIRQYYGLNVGCGDESIRINNNTKTWEKPENQAEYDDVTGKIGAYLSNNRIE